MIEATTDLFAASPPVKNTSIRVTEKLKSKFWPKVQQGSIDECWEWLGVRTARGYGRMRIGDHLVIAHRISYTIQHGEIPEGLFVCHKCDNPPCCNPAHLFLGTPLENAGDMVRKGRQTRGEKHCRAKLTDEQVIEIRQRWAARPTQQQLADEYGISVTVLNRVLYKRAWGHVGPLTDYKGLRPAAPIPPLECAESGSI